MRSPELTRRSSDKTLRRKLAVVLSASGLPLLALAQPALPPEAIEQFNQTIGNRVEAVTILGGEQGAVRGIYSYRGGRLADLSVTKIGGGGELAEPKPVGGGGVGLRWSPVLQGNVGHVNAENEFAAGYLAGNAMVYDVLALQAGGGVRIFFNDRLSLAPLVSGIYGHTENEFTARNPVGDAIQAVGSGSYVDWEMDTWSIVPALDGRYEWSWGRTELELSSRYCFFHTESFNSSTSVVNLDGDSHTWENRFGADVPLGLTVLGRELRSGGFFSRTELGGNVAAGVGAPHFYTANVRMVVDFLGKVWGLRWLGAGCSYFWADEFNGWSAGIDLRLRF